MFGNNKCNGRIQYDRNANEFYFVTKHNNLCEKKNITIYDNNDDIETNIYKYEDYKSKLIDYLNTNPLISIFGFKKYALKLFI